MACQRLECYAIRRLISLRLQPAPLLRYNTHTGDCALVVRRLYTADFGASVSYFHVLFVNFQFGFMM